MNDIKKAFAQCKAQNRVCTNLASVNLYVNLMLVLFAKPALITYVTAGFPSPTETPDILLGLQTGGADIIELGIPFTDPIADGPTIQEANSVALRQKVNVESCLRMVRVAREQGLYLPVLLMGYYNPLLSYGEDKILKAARFSGISGFIIVDLPPEEACSFRKSCRREGSVTIDEESLLH